MGNLDRHFGCCNGRHLAENFFECDKECETDLAEELDNLVQNNDFPSAASSYFESNSGAVINLGDVLLCMSDFSNELSKPPPSFSVKVFLEKLINDANEDSYSQSVKSAAKYGTDNLDDFELLACLFWCRIFELFENYFTENLEELHMTNKDFTCATSKLQLLFLSQEYRSDLISAYSVKKWIEIDDGQRSVGALLLFHLFQLFGTEVGKRVRQKEERAPIRFNVCEMGPDGRGKVRYVGGWAIRKCLNRARSYVLDNKLSQSSSVLLKISKEMKKIDLLENYITLPHEAAQVSTAYPESLRVIEARQYRERGLIHISDDAFGFFMALEQERVDKINIHRLSSLQNDMVDDAIAEAVSNSTLETAFLKLFFPDADANKNVILEIFKEIIERYFKMGAGQFLRDFRRDFHIKKSLAHREAVLQKKKKAEDKRLKVQIPEIEHDRSLGKKVSHVRLLDLVLKLGSGGIARLYSKKELQHLCAAYNIRYLSRWNKIKLASELAQTIPRLDAVPCHEITSTYTVDVLDENSHGIPVLRIRRL